MNRHRTPAQIEEAAEAASRKARAGGPSRKLLDGTVVSVGASRRLKLTDTGIVLNGTQYPVRGARVEVADFRSGLMGRRHTITVTITLATGAVLPWTLTTAGTMSRVVYRQAVAFAAAANTAAAR